MSPLEQYYQTQAQRNHRAVVLWFTDEGISEADFSLHSHSGGNVSREVPSGNLPSTELVLHLIEEKRALRIEASDHFRMQLGQEHGFAFVDFTQEWNADI